MDQAFQGAAWVDTEAFAPIAGAEAATKVLAASSVEGPHEVGLPGAEARSTKACAPHAGGAVFGDAGVGVALAAGDFEVVGGALAAHGQ